MEIMSTYGSYLLILGPLLTFMLLVVELGKEKEKKLRQGLNVVGVSHFTYWMHWLIVGTLINLIQTMILMITGYIYKFGMWNNAPFSIIFTICFSFGQFMVFFAFLISTVIKTEAQACNISYAVILICLLVDGVFCNVELIFGIFYNKRSLKIDSVRFAVKLFEYFPAYAYCMAFGIVAMKASRCFDLNGMNWVEGKPYEMSDYYAKPRIDISVVHDHITVPSAASAMHKLYIDIIIVAVLWIYFDHILASNRGAPETFYFMF